MRSFLVLALLLMLTQELWAQTPQKAWAGFDVNTDLISDKYEAGPYLIYDCEDGHWTCVMEPFYEECKKKREEDLLDKKLSARCAAIGSFPNKKSCFQRQLFMTSNNHGARVCILAPWKEKEMIFGYREFQK